MKFKNALVILGQTCVGKTRVARELALALGGEIIHADKFYFYDFFKISIGLDIKEYQGIRTNLFGIFSPLHERIDRIEYCKIVEKVVPDILYRNSLPIIDGCSVGYTTSLIQANKQTDREFIYSPIIYLRFPPHVQPIDKYKTRLDIILNNGALQEVKMALNNGYRNSYVLKKGIICQPLVDYLDGKLTYENAYMHILDGFERIGKDETHAFETLDNVHCIEHDDNDPESFQKTVNIITELIRTCNFL